MESYIHIIKGHRLTLLLFTVVCGVLAGIFTLGRTLNYSATSRLFITQRAAFTLDPYTAIRSVELIGENLAQIIQTSSFFDRMLKSGYNINQNYFSKEESKRRREWKKMVDANVASGTGLLEIKVYHPDRDQSAQIASAIALLLTKEGSDYIGRDIQVRLVDTPITSRFPVRPSIPGNIAIGGLLGFIFGNFYIYIDHRRRKHRGALI